MPVGEYEHVWFFVSMCPSCNELETYPKVGWGWLQPLCHPAKEKQLQTTDECLDVCLYLFTYFLTIKRHGR